MENLGYLMAAYSVIWVVVFGYVLFMQRKQRRLQQQIKQLQDSIHDSEKTDER